MNKVSDIVNDNESYKHTINSNDNVTDDPFYEEKIADWVANQLNGHSEVNLKYYRILAHYLPLPLIHRLIGTAKELGRDPLRYFSYISKLELEKYKKLKRGMK